MAVLPENNENGEYSAAIFSTWAKALAIAGLALVLFWEFQKTGWLSGADLQSGRLTLGISFLVGVAASLSSCLAVVGGVVVAFAEKYKSGKSDFFGSAVRPNLLFHVGRFTSFFVLGGLLGFVGGGINISGNFVSFYAIAIAVIMGWIGLNILGIAPSISALGIQPPKIFRKYWYKLEESNHRVAPLVLGGLTFFLPCGFTQSMQIFALASGSFWAGATALLFFSLGTAPVLLALGVGASWGKLKKIVVLKKAAGILIIIFAFFTMRSALALRGVKTNIISSVKNEEQGAEKERAVVGPGVSSEKDQTVEMSVTSRGFEPSVLRIKRGVPVNWVIKGVQVSGCTNKIIIPGLNIAKNINSGENTIKFTPPGGNEIPFSCGMGMVRGKFIVEP